VIEEEEEEEEKEEEEEEEEDIQMDPPARNHNSLSWREAPLSPFSTAIGSL
jgi:hypothetical protein